MARVFIDTNVLFPFSVMDLLLALTEDSVHEVIWSRRLLDEWERVIVRTHRRSAESAAAVTAAIRDFFPEYEIDISAYGHLVDQMPSPDADDRHHIAAALAGGARQIVTWNLADFPGEPLAQLGLRVVEPDEYLCELLDEVPDEVLAAVARLAAEKRNPRLTAVDLCDALEKAGVREFAHRVRLRFGVRDAGLGGGVTAGGAQAAARDHRAHAPEEVAAVRPEGAPSQRPLTC